jgi:chromosome segregation ATPase
VEADEENELRGYREKVVAELERRTCRLRDLEEEMGRIEYQLESANRGRRKIIGETARIQVEAAHRAKLKGELRTLSRDRDVALADLQKAEIRLTEVDRRIKELEKEEQEA